MVRDRPYPNFGRSVGSTLYFGDFGTGRETLATVRVDRRVAGDAPKCRSQPGGPTILAAKDDKGHTLNS